MNTTSTMATISERFIIDFINKKIIGTKASFDKASKGSGAIYEELATKVAKHPAFELVIKEQKKRINKPKKVYDGLTFEFMEQYIAIHDGAESVMREFKAVKNTYKGLKMSVYPFTKKWFLDKYKGFDMATARAEIVEARMKRKQSVSCPLSRRTRLFLCPKKIGLNPKAKELKGVYENG